MIWKYLRLGLAKRLHNAWEGLKSARGELFTY